MIHSTWRFPSCGTIVNKKFKRKFSEHMLKNYIGWDKEQDMKKFDTFCRNFYNNKETTLI